MEERLQIALMKKCQCLANKPCRHASPKLRQPLCNNQESLLRLENSALWVLERIKLHMSFQLTIEMTSLNMAYPKDQDGLRTCPLEKKKNDGISSLKTQCCSATEVLGRVKTESLPQLITTCAVQGCLSVLWS